MLEDALIGELNKSDKIQTFKIWRVSRKELRSTLQHLQLAVDAFTRSIDDMETHPFLHASVLEQMDFVKLKSHLASTGAMNADDEAFDEVVTSLKNGGFERIFRELKRRYVRHHEAAIQLLIAFEAGERYARNGSLLQMIEQNELPFRLRFARLMNPLTRTMQIFSYSSLISIEIHYRSTHCRPGRVSFRITLFKRDIPFSMRGVSFQACTSLYFLPCVRMLASIICAHLSKRPSIY